MALNPKSAKRTTAFAKLESLRLLVAGEIICYLVNTRDARIHISLDMAAEELFDQYSIKLFLQWLAHRKGFPAYTNGIQPANQATFGALDSRPAFANRYPFYSYFPREFEEATAHVAFEYLNANCQSDVELTGVLYMQTMSTRVSVDASYAVHIEPRTNGRRGGEFYTPDRLARRCIQEPFLRDSVRLINEFRRNSDTDVQSDCNYKVLDPACGCGNFLLAALKLFNDSRAQNNKSGEPLSAISLASQGRLGTDIDPKSAIAVHCESLGGTNIDTGSAITFASECLFGTDIDMKAVSIARTLLMIALSPSLSALANIIEASASFEDYLSKLMARISSHIVCADPLSGLPLDAPAGFDLVVTNPPYISFGARNQPPLHEGLARYLRNTFPSASEYKIRLHSIFQELCVQVCKPGGRIVLLVPDAFLNGAYYGKLRRLLVSECQIVSLTELPESTFKDAVAGRWCIADYEKKSATPDTTTTPRMTRLTRVRKKPSKTVPVGADEADAALTLLTGGAGVPPASSPALSKKLLNVGETNDPEETQESFYVSLAQLVTKDKSRFQLVFNQTDASLLEKMADSAMVRSLYRGHTGMRSKLGQLAIVRDDLPAVQGNWNRGIVSGGNVLRHSVSWDGKWIDVSPEKLYAGGFDPHVIGQPKLLVRQTADRLIGGVDSGGLYHLNNVHSFAPLKTLELSADARLEAVFYLAGLLNSSLWLYLYQLKSREENRALAQIDIEMVEALPLPPASIELQSAIATLARAANSAPDRYLRAIDRLVYEIYKIKTDEIAHIENGRPRPNKRSNSSHEPLPSSAEARKLVEFCLQTTV